MLFFFENLTSRILLPLAVFTLFSPDCFLLFVDALFVLANDFFVVSDYIILVLVSTDDVMFRLLFALSKMISHLENMSVV